MLVAAALCGGFVDAIAGGGGLITVPALLLAGLTPVEAVATNKLQGTFGVASAAASYWRAGYVAFPSRALTIFCAAAGAIAGALAVEAFDQRWLAAAIPFVLIAVAAYFALAAKPREGDGARRIGAPAFAVGVAAPIGFYDGFFGPGAGSFYTLVFVALAGAGLLRAIGGTKVLNLTSNLASLIVFVLSGHVLFAIGLAMALGQVAGAWLGARAAIAHGSRLIRLLIVIVSWAIALRLLIDPANPAGEWLRTAGARLF
jgi:hypothetical protein